MVKAALRALWPFPPLVRLADCREFMPDRLMPLSYHMTPSYAHAAGPLRKHPVIERPCCTANWSPAHGIDFCGSAACTTIVTPSGLNGTSLSARLAVYGALRRFVRQ